MELERSLRIQFHEAEVLLLADLGGSGTGKSNPSLFFSPFKNNTHDVLMMEFNTTQSHSLGLELKS